MGLPIPKTVLTLVLDQITHIRDSQDRLEDAFVAHRVESEHRFTSIESKTKGVAGWISLIVAAIVSALAAFLGVGRAS